MKKYDIHIDDYTYTVDENIEAKAGMWCVDFDGNQIFKMGNAFDTYPESMKDSVQRILDNAKVKVSTNNPEIKLDLK